MENPNHLNEPNEAILEVNPVVPQSNQVVDIHDPNEMVDILDDIDLVDYDEEDHEEDPEEELEEDVDIELEDDVELIFPYEVEGDKPHHLEMCHLIRCHPSLSQRTRRSMLHPRLLLGLLPKSLMLFATFREAYLRELLNHDLENVERALGNVLERMSVLESRENAILKKRLAKTNTKLLWARIERENAERRLHESRVWNKRFYLDMVRIGAVLKPPSDDEDTERPRKKLKNSTSDGT
nr:hypothetical protein [Tanacetum cinerariifolium]